MVDNKRFGIQTYNILLLKYSTAYFFNPPAHNAIILKQFS